MIEKLSIKNFKSIKEVLICIRFRTLKEKEKFRKFFYVLSKLVLSKLDNEINILKKWIEQYDL